MASKDPAVLFYTSDFLSGAALMSMKERGQYITLLCLQRERGHMTLKEMEKAAGKLSEEVKGKFVPDDEGKFYNIRMEKEIKKRQAHSQKQRENVAKRWNKPKDDGGIYDGNTMVLPLGNGNGNIYPSAVKGVVGNVEETTPPISPPSPIAAVFSAYAAKISEKMNETIRDELIFYTKEMGPDCCIRAMDEAIESNAISWRYVKGVLKNKLSAGVRSLKDWNALEEKKGRKEAGADGSHAKGVPAGWKPKSALDDAD